MAINLKIFNLIINTPSWHNGLKNNPFVSWKTCIFLIMLLLHSRPGNYSVRDLLTLTVALQMESIKKRGRDPGQSSGYGESSKVIK